MDKQIICYKYIPEYERIKIYKEYVIIKNSRIETLIITTKTSNITVKGIIFLNCKINKLEFDEVCVNILHIINSHINIVCVHYIPYGMNCDSEINYLKLYKSNITDLDLTWLYNKKRFKFEKINTYITKCSDRNPYKYHKKLNKKLFYHLKKMK